MLVWRNNVGNLVVLKTGEHWYLRNRRGVAVDTASFTSSERSAGYARGGAKSWNGARGSSRPFPAFFFFFARICQLATKKEMKMIASQDSKIVIQSIRSITGHLPDGKKASCSFKPSRLGVLLISYVTLFMFWLDFNIWRIVPTAQKLI